MTAILLTKKYDNVDTYQLLCKICSAVYAANSIQRVKGRYCVTSSHSFLLRCTISVV